MGSALAEKLDNIKQRGAMTGPDVAELLGTSAETVAQWIDGKSDPQSDGLMKILQLEFFLAELAEFYEPADAHVWLYSPHKLLDGATPADRIKEGRTDVVFALLDQMRSGAFV